LTVITYKISLEADGFSAIELPVSSFNYSSSSVSFSGSFMIQGHDYASEIAERATGGVITLIQTVDGVDTDFFEADVDQIDTFLSTDSNTYQISFTDGDYSQSAYSGPYTIDDKISFASFQSASWSFRISELTPDIQHGISASYQGIDYYISDVNYNYDSESFGFLTMNEGTMTPEAADGAQCYDDVSVGDTIEDEFDETCYVAREGEAVFVGWGGHDGYRRYSSSDILAQFPTDGQYFRRYTLTLTEEKEVTITLTSTALPDYSTTPAEVWAYGGFFAPSWYKAYDYTASKGLILVIASGEFDNKYDRPREDAGFYYLTNGQIFSGTLPAGVYTLQLYLFTAWADVAADPSFTIEIAEAV
jgi:hypothetical protein